MSRLIRANVRSWASRLSETKREDVAEDVDRLQDRADGGTERAVRQQRVDELFLADRDGRVGERVRAGDVGQQGVAGDRADRVSDTVEDPIRDDVADRDVREVVRDVAHQRRAGGRDGLLLGDVRRLVRHERDVGRRGLGGEEDRRARRECPGAQVARRGCGLRTSADADVGEIGAEVRLDPLPDGCIQRTAAAGGGDDRQDGSWKPTVGARDRGRSAHGRKRAQRTAGGNDAVEHAQGDGVGLTLERVARLRDRELRLHDRCVGEHDLGRRRPARRRFDRTYRYVGLRCALAGHEFECGPRREGRFRFRRGGLGRRRLRAVWEQWPGHRPAAWRRRARPRTPRSLLGFELGLRLDRCGRLRQGRRDRRR